MHANDLGYSANFVAFSLQMKRMHASVFIRIHKGGFRESRRGDSSNDLGLDFVPAAVRVLGILTGRLG